MPCYLDISRHYPMKMTGDEEGKGGWRDVLDPLLVILLLMAF